MVPPDSRTRRHVEGRIRQQLSKSVSPAQARILARDYVADQLGSNPTAEDVARLAKRIDAMDHRQVLDHVHEELAVAKDMAAKLPKPAEPDLERQLKLSVDALKGAKKPAIRMTEPSGGMSTEQAAGYAEARQVRHRGRTAEAGRAVAAASHKSPAPVTQSKPQAADAEGLDLLSALGKQSMAAIPELQAGARNGGQPPSFLKPRGPNDSGMGMDGPPAGQSQSIPGGLQDEATQNVPRALMRTGQSSAPSDPQSPSPMHGTAFEGRPMPPPAEPWRAPPPHVPLPRISAQPFQSASTAMDESPLLANQPVTMPPSPLRPTMGPPAPRDGRPAPKEFGASPYEQWLQKRGGIAQALARPGEDVRNPGLSGDVGPVPQEQMSSAANKSIIAPDNPGPVATGNELARIDPNRALAISPNAPSSVLRDPGIASPQDPRIVPEGHPMNPMVGEGHVPIGPSADGTFVMRAPEPVKLPGMGRALGGALDMAGGYALGKVGQAAAEEYLPPQAQQLLGQAGEGMGAWDPISKTIGGVEDAAMTAKRALHPGSFGQTPDWLPKFMGHALERRGITNAPTDFSNAPPGLYDSTGASVPNNWGPEDDAAVERELHPQAAQADPNTNFDPTAPLPHMGSEGQPITDGPTADTPNTPQPQDSGDVDAEAVWRAISRGESRDNYGATNPNDPGGAYGMGQVIGENLHGRQYSRGEGFGKPTGTVDPNPLAKQILGHTVEPDEFLADHEMQDKLYRGMVSRYAQMARDKGLKGPQAERWIARAWNGGEGWEKSGPDTQAQLDRYEKKYFENRGLEGLPMPERRQMLAAQKAAVGLGSYTKGSEVNKKTGISERDPTESPPATQYSPKRDLEKLPLKVQLSRDEMHNLPIADARSAPYVMQSRAMDDAHDQLGAVDAAMKKSRKRTFGL